MHGDRPSSIETQLVHLEGVTKVFRTGRVDFPALRGIDLSVERNEFVAIVGPSGSGKSTILNIVTGIDRPTEGRVVVGGSRIHDMSEEELAVWRGRTVGIVFQFFQLLPTLTAVENAMLPLDFDSETTGEERLRRALANLERVGLTDKADHLPMELSGGEQQRVAIARALAREPELLVADEPTGNLDSATAARVLELMSDLHRDGTTIVFVTHDRELARRADRVVGVRDGLLA
ncbi:MAG TPA: ABC transporter ATP-binding protein [Acidimicrobiia bacterium]|nr:ABC transporter ATP-binding protein [Acidimicrobiia bacterium]